MIQVLGLADLHVHTLASDGLASVEEVLSYAEHRIGLDVVCITDHDDLSSGLHARDLGLRERYRCAVVPGMEITTLNGHLLALFLEEPVPSMRSLAVTIEAVHRLGGLCVIPHPLSWLVHSVGQAHLEELLWEDIPEQRPDAFEVANPSPAGRITQRLARELNRGSFGLAEVGGSDAHFIEAVGTGFTRFPGSTPEALKKAILEGTTVAGLASPRQRPRINPSLPAKQLLRSLVIQPTRLAMRVALQALGEK